MINHHDLATFTKMKFLLPCNLKVNHMQFRTKDVCSVIYFMILANSYSITLEIDYNVCQQVQYHNIDSFFIFKINS